MQKNNPEKKSLEISDLIDACIDIAKEEGKRKTKQHYSSEKYSYHFRDGNLKITYEEPFNFGDVEKIKVSSNDKNVLSADSLKEGKILFRIDDDLYVHEYNKGPWKKVVENKQKNNPKNLIKTLKKLAKSGKVTTINRDYNTQNFYHYRNGDFYVGYEEGTSSLNPKRIDVTLKGKTIFYASTEEKMVRLLGLKEKDILKVECEKCKFYIYDFDKAGLKKAIRTLEEEVKRRDLAFGKFNAN